MDNSIVVLGARVVLWIGIVSESQLSEKGSHGRLSILASLLLHHSNLWSPIDRTHKALLNPSEALSNLYKLVLSLLRALPLFILTQDIILVS